MASWRDAGRRSSASCYRKGERGTSGVALNADGGSGGSVSGRTLLRYVECMPDAFGRPVRGVARVAAVALVVGVSCSQGGGSVYSGVRQALRHPAGSPRSTPRTPGPSSRCTPGGFITPRSRRRPRPRRSLSGSVEHDRAVGRCAPRRRPRQKTVPYTGPENASGHFTMMITGDVAWVQQPVGPGQPVSEGQPQGAQTCHGLSPAAALVMGCPPHGLFQG